MKNRMKRFWRKALCACLACTMLLTQLGGSIAFAEKAQNSLYMEASQKAGAMFRWWVPAAIPMISDADIVRQEIEGIARVGYQGIEVSVISGSGDLENYGWGTAGWTEMLTMICEMALQLDLTVDVTVTCGWPISLPAKYAYEDYDALEKNLYEGEYATIQGGTVTKAAFTKVESTNPWGGTSVSIVPQDVVLAEGEDLVLATDQMEDHDASNPLVKRTLQSVTVAKIVGAGSVDKGQQYYQWGNGNPGREGRDGSFESVLLDPDSLTVLEEGTDYTLDEASGKVTIQWRPEDDGEYRVFTYWMGFSGATSSKGTVDTNYYADYMTQEGVKAYQAFWEDRILHNEKLAGLIKQVGMSLFEDSLEFGSYFGEDRLEWGTTFLQEFESRMGYDLAPYLPLLEGQSMGGTTNVEYYDYEFGSYNEESGKYEYDGACDRIRNDLTQVYTELFTENHIEPLTEWAHENGMYYRQQPMSFNYDAAYIAASCDYPDVETLGFFEITSDGGKYRHGYDKSRIVAAGAHMGERAVVSSECGALPGLCYRMTWAKIMEYIQLQYALGANRMIFHGYSHLTGGTQWPGAEGFGTGLADNWGDRNPSWEYETSVAEYMSRAQDILRSGDPSVDVAVFNDYYSSFAPLWEDELLELSGYSYDFVTANLLKLDTAYVEDGILAPGAGSYQALIFDEQTYISVETAQKILDYLNKGLKVFVIGDFPDKVPSFCDYKAEEEQLAQVTAQIMAHKNTFTAESEQAVVGVMKAQGVSPRAALSEPAKVITAHRVIDGADYYYLYNDSRAEVQQEITLEGTGNLYLIDLWSGEVTQAADYTVDSSNGTVTRTFTLKANESVMAAVTEGALYQVEGSGPALKSTQTAVPDQGSTEVLDGKVQLKADGNGTYAVAYGDGCTEEVSVSGLPETCVLSSGWKLQVERWENNTDTSDITYDTKKTLIDVGTLDRLVPWSEIEALGPDVSGIGFYTNTFTLPETWNQADGAVLTLPVLDEQLFGCTIAEVRVNGTKVSVDQNHFTADAAGLLQAGENTLEVTLASPLGNQLIAYGRLNNEPSAYGLIGDVTLAPYEYVQLKELPAEEPESSDPSAEESSDPSSTDASKEEQPGTGEGGTAFLMMSLVLISAAAVFVMRKQTAK